MSDLPSLPAWAKTLQRRIRQRGIDFFILSGPGVRDLHALGARRFGTIGECLAQVILKRRIRLSRNPEDGKLRPPERAEEASVRIRLAPGKAEVTNDSKSVDGFQITFSLAKGILDYTLLTGGTFDPFEQPCLNPATRRRRRQLAMTPPWRLPTNPSPWSKRCSASLRSIPSFSIVPLPPTLPRWDSRSAAPLFSAALRMRRA